jgi:hypothetical protein
MGVKVTYKEEDLGAREIQRQIKKLKKSHTDVGLFGNGESASTNLAERAAVHEYGTKNGNIPSRPFMRNAFDNNLKKLQKYIIVQYGKMIDRRIKAKGVLKKTGGWFEGKIKDSILIGPFVALKKQTKDRKKSSKPLIDTGQMRNSVEHRETMK